MATFEIVKQEELKMVRAVLDNETIQAEAGALHYMIGDIELKTKAPSAKGFLTSMVTKESVIKPSYTGTGEVFFGPPIFGEYYTLELNNEEWVLDKGAYVCSDGDIEMGAFRNKAISGLVGGEGLFQTKISGSGTVILKAQGKVQIIDLDNQRLTVDGSFAVARQAHLKYALKKAAKGLIGSVASGEGLVNVIEGQGRVLIAPVPNLYQNLISSYPLPGTSG